MAIQESLQKRLLRRVIKRDLPVIGIFLGASLVVLSCAEPPKLFQQIQMSREERQLFSSEVGCESAEDATVWRVKQRGPLFLWRVTCVAKGHGLEESEFLCQKTSLEFDSTVICQRYNEGDLD